MLNHALDFIFPPQCPTCETLVPEHGALCLSCWQSIKFITDPLCHACGKPFEFSIGEQALCGECLKELPSFAQARSVFVYDEHSRGLITKLKFSDQLYLASIFSPWLMKTGKSILSESQIIIPVPLSYRRFISRRYNQAALLARSLAQKTHIPMIPDALIRKKHTLPQTGLSQRQREENVQGAFAINPRYKNEIKNKTVLLMDDVLTTGSTVSACTKQLLKAGALRVNVLTLARTNI